MVFLADILAFAWTQCIDILGVNYGQSLCSCEMLLVHTRKAACLKLPISTA